MPNLGDYIGRLLSEITIARMQADLESMRIAELYATEPLLRAMPVPHFRLPSIDIDLPVVIAVAEEKGVAKEAPSPESMQKVFAQAMDKTLADKKVELKPSERKSVASAISRTATALAKPKGPVVSPTTAAQEFASAAIDQLKKTDVIKDKSKYAALEDELKTAARSEFIAIQPPPVRLKVAATTAEVKEAGPSEVLTQVHLRIIEEAFEWTTIETEGKKRDKLVIE